MEGKDLVAWTLKFEVTTKTIWLDGESAKPK